MKKLTPGMTVMVWKRPYKRDEKEGVAVLVTPCPYGVPRDGFENWMVRLGSEGGPLCTRTVSAIDIVKEG